jgi:hypothetical protein
LEGEGTIRFLREGKTYTGTFRNGQPHGQGTMKYDDGRVKSGQWVKGYFIT